MKKTNVSIGILLLLFTVFVYLEHTAPRPADWSPNINPNKKTPYGTYIVMHELKTFFPKQDLTENRMSYYQFLKNTELTNQNLLFLAAEFQMGRDELNKIMDFVAKGNNMFVAAYSISKILSDTLGFKTDTDMKFGINNDTITRIILRSPETKLHEMYTYHKSLYDMYFDSLGTRKHDNLGFTEDKKPNFVAFHHGKGRIYVHLEPLVFTNYYFLNDHNRKYIESCLSYLPRRPLIWDNFSSNQDSYSGTPSIMRYIKSKEALRNTYFLVLLGILMYFIFGTRRRQRAIPVIEPFKNSSLEFVETLSRLYLRGNNHKDIALKRFRFFVDYIYDKFYLRMQLNKCDTEMLSKKISVEKKKLDALISLYNKVNNASQISETQLHNFSKLLDDLYKQIEPEKYK